jgi:hypothetical protein
MSPRAGERSVPRLGIIGCVCLTAACPLYRPADDLIEDTLYSATKLGGVDDLEFERAAAPAGLMALEALHHDEPTHLGTLNALAAAYAQYAYAFLELDAERIEDTSPGEASELRRRARLIFLRARDFGLAGLDRRHPGFRTFIRGDPALVLDWLSPDDVSLLYWAATAWAAAYSDQETGQDVEAVESMMQRALILDDEFAEGAIYEYFALHYAAGPEGKPRDIAKARSYLARALELSHGRNLSFLVSWGNLACAYRHSTVEFHSYLQRVLAFDLRLAPDNWMGNEIAQRRARFLSARVQDCSAVHHKARPDNVGMRLTALMSGPPPGATRL